VFAPPSSPSSALINSAGITAARRVMLVLVLFGSQITCFVRISTYLKLKTTCALCVSVDQPRQKKKGKELKKKKNQA
jgi:hypothetical protein